MKNFTEISHEWNISLELNGNFCTNVTLLEEEHILSQDAVWYGLPIVYFVSILLATCGNIFWIIFLWRSSRGRRSSNVLLIMNLAFCDLLKSVLVAPLRMVELHLFKNQEATYHTINICCFINCFELYLSFVGFHTVMAISQERLCIICFPFYARKWLNQNVALATIFLISAISLATSLLYSLFYSQIVIVHPTCKTAYNVCSYTFVLSTSRALGARYFTLAVTIFYYIIPVIVVSISYAKIVVSLKKTIEMLKRDVFDGQSNHPGRDIRSKEIMAKASNSADKKSSDKNSTSKGFSNKQDGAPLRHSVKSTLKVIKSRKSLSYLMIIVAVCFTICHGPLIFMSLFMSFGYRMDNNTIFVLILFKWLSVVSSVINPNVYSTNKRAFRRQ
ncbi:hypothetical protein HELRODRAFT_167610 [Helobdella robusta]|uniref:G-protein coupled receptors family 1 profile domain-containing protein n=1 Tax=Helobdella robusta TaxID=6412 RepID=T1EZJ9_HELRO|nr:hypothetical protein HELRODRAFT_167610 [Helobdella robusta]ESO11079.1 hypothetical protein HELRODRAFT_167610 [Helobdella robusta]